MKITLLTLFFVTFISCVGCSNYTPKRKVMPLHYKTSMDEGINYYRSAVNLSLPDGQLICENLSELPLCISIYNRSEGYKLQYEAKIEPKKYIAYTSLSPSDKYVLGISVKSDVGSKDVNLLLYNSYDYYYSKTSSDKVRLVTKDKSTFSDFVDELGLVLIL